MANPAINAVFIQTMDEITQNGVPLTECVDKKDSLCTKIIEHEKKTLVHKEFSSICSSPHQTTIPDFDVCMRTIRSCGDSLIKNMVLGDDAELLANGYTLQVTNNCIRKQLQAPVGK